MALTRRFAAAGACVAAISLVATPVAALELPRSAPAIYQVDKANGWGRRYHHHDRIDAGDVLAGVLILGGIAAIASAASKSKQREANYPAPPPYPQQDRQGYRDNGYGYPSDGRGLDDAVSMCVDQVERGRDRVGSVDSANRTAEGWTVSGALEGGAGFTCRIDNEGRIRALDIGGSRAGLAPAVDRQYSDEAYARARMASQSNEPGVAPPQGTADNRPVWHGDSGQVDGDLGG